MEEKYLLIKGINGLCNMLSALSKGIQLARESNRIIVVDWVNCSWKTGFDKYFELHDDIKHMKYQDFIMQNNENKTIFPIEFKNKLNANVYHIYPDIDNLKIINYNKYFGNINDGTMINGNYEILVYCYNYVGDKYFIDLWSKISVNDEIMKEYNTVLMKNKMEIYDAIHVRYTDCKHGNLDWVTEILENDNNKNKKYYIATDNKKVLIHCILRHDNIFNNLTILKIDEPMHLIDCETREKEIINRESIIDLLILGHANVLYINPIYDAYMKGHITMNIHPSTYSIYAKLINSFYKKLN